MAFVVEDGTGLSTATAYVSVEEFEAYAADRGESLVAYTLQQKQSAIVVASIDYLDGYFTFKGVPLEDDQALSLPTDQVTVNAKIKQAACAAALLKLKGRLFVDPEEITRQIVAAESSSVGSLSESITYDGGSQYIDKYPTVQIDRLVIPYTVAQVGVGYALRG
jgi:hypothetical protein